jgi:predicted alpha/beta hydrolase family esterase
MSSPLVHLPSLTILTIPGLEGSGPEHWQSRWEAELSGCRRVEMPDWARPRRAEWVDALQASITSASTPVVLVAHSLGCHAVAWWAKENWQVRFEGSVVGALLVAPPCVERECATDRIADFRPAPRLPLPFPTFLIASRNDPYASFATSARLAAMWGSCLVEAGEAGHINAESGLGTWEDGLALLESLVAASRPRDQLHAPVRAADREPLPSGGGRWL